MIVSGRVSDCFAHRDDKMSRHVFNRIWWIEAQNPGSTLDTCLVRRHLGDQELPAAVPKDEDRKTYTIH